MVISISIMLGNFREGGGKVYCSLNKNRCCGESDGKWMCIAYLNMSDPSARHMHIHIANSISACNMIATN